MDEVQKRLQVLSDVYQKLQTGTLSAPDLVLVLLTFNAVCCTQSSRTPSRLDKS
jgi:hypothetical protein